MMLVFFLFVQFCPVFIILNSSVLLNAFNIRFFFTYSGSQLSVIMVSATTDLLESASGNNSVDG